MKTKLKSIVLCLATGIFLFACGSGESSDYANEAEEVAVEPASSDEMTEYIDATVVAAENYKLLSEEGSVRIIEMLVELGISDNTHSHKNETVYFLSGGKVQITAGGETMDAEIPDGHVMHHGPWTHSVKNVGESTVHAIILEQMKLDPSSDFEGYIDATEASADNYKLLSSEGNVRVISMTLAAGQSDIEHSHKSESVYFISGGKVKIYVGDEVMEAEIPDGHIMHHGPWTHRVENVGETTIEAIVFERI